jgi:hypothetical protein
LWLIQLAIFLFLTPNAVGSCEECIALVHVASAPGHIFLTPNAVVVIWRVLEHMSCFMFSEPAAGFQFQSFSIAPWFWHFPYLEDYAHHKHYHHHHHISQRVNPNIPISIQIDTVQQQENKTWKQAISTFQ